MAPSAVARGTIASLRRQIAKIEGRLAERLGGEAEDIDLVRHGGVPDGGDLLVTGAGRFDAVLGGGLPRNSISLIIGLPGTGKTILAQHYVFANAQPSRPAL